MKMKKLAAALLAAAVLATTVAPTATPVFAATTAETTATDATPEQEVTVKKPAKATVAAKNNAVPSRKLPEQQDTKYSILHPRNLQRRLQSLRQPRRQATP
jgi:hypothetical protein